MGGSGSGRRPSTFNPIRTNLASAGSEPIEIPNHSGIADHPEAKKNFVPYTGANADVDLNNYQLSNIDRLFVTNNITVDDGGVHGSLIRGDGAAAAPTYSFHDDPDTGMYSLANDTLSFSTNGTGRLTIGTTGNFDFQAGDLTTTGDLSCAELTATGDANIDGDIYFDGNSGIWLNSAASDLTLSILNSDIIKKANLSVEGTLFAGGKTQIGTTTTGAELEANFPTGTAFDCNGSSVFDRVMTHTAGTVRNTTTSTDIANVADGTGTYIGWEQNVRFHKNGDDGHITNSIGIKNRSTHAWASHGNIALDVGLQSEFQCAGATYTGLITEARCFYAFDNYTGTKRVTTLSGLYVNDITAATTNNYAIYTNAGDVSLGDDLLLRNDNDKIRLGATATDLEIYSDGTNAVFSATGKFTFDKTAEFASKIKLTAIGGYAIKLTNKSGANSVAGEVVIASTANADAVASGAASELQPIGVFLDDGITDGSEAWIVVSGIADVKADGTGWALGDRIVTSATAKRGAVNNAPTAAVHFQELGHAIEAAAANALGRCVLHQN